MFARRLEKSRWETLWGTLRDFGDHGANLKVDEWSDRAGLVFVSTGRIEHSDMSECGEKVLEGVRREAGEDFDLDHGDLASRNGLEVPVNGDSQVGQ